jgi:hypothetical protein
VIFYGGLFLIAAFNLFHAHEHCMKQTGLSLRLYARDHGGRFPFHTNGFGDAIVMLLRENTSAPARLFTAPGDDGTMLRECMKTGADVPENRCTRAYVQGLSESDDPGIAVVFDRYPTRGGDHFRRPWGPFQREVCFLDSSMLVVGEQKWSEFHRKQIELLVAAGISMTEAEKYYEPPVK